MTDHPRPEVVDLLVELALAESVLDLPAQRRCGERLRAAGVRPCEEAQARVLAQACEEALAPARACQREARAILLPRLAAAGSSDLDGVWAALSPAERARLVEIVEWLHEPVRSWVSARVPEVG